MKKCSGLVIAVMLVLTSCQSTGPLREVPTGTSATALNELSENPAYLKTYQLLQQLGYEGVGLIYESESTLDLIYQVFSDGRAAKRKLKLVYTGLANSYDPKYQSLTLSTQNDKESILRFIVKSIPVRE